MPFSLFIYLFFFLEVMAARKDREEWFLRMEVFSRTRELFSDGKNAKRIVYFCF